MPKRNVKYIISGGLLLIIAAIGVYYYLNPRRALTLIFPGFEKINFVTAHIQSDTAHVTLAVVATNKAPYIINIDSIKYSILLDNILLVKENLGPALVLHKKQTDTIPLYVRIPISKVRNTLTRLHQHDSAMLTANIDIDYNTMFGNMHFGFSKKQKVKVFLPPEIKLLKVERKRIRPFKKKMEVEVHLLIINHSDFLNLTLTGLEYTVNFTSISGRGAHPSPVYILPSSSTVVSLPLELDMESPVKTLYNVLFDKDKSPYQLRVTATLQPGSLEKTPIELTASGITELVK